MRERSGIQFHRPFILLWHLVALEEEGVFIPLSLCLSHSQIQIHFLFLSLFFFFSSLFPLLCPLLLSLFPSLPNSLRLSKKVYNPSTTHSESNQQTYLDPIQTNRDGSIRLLCDYIFTFSSRPGTRELFRFESWENFMSCSLRSHVTLHETVLMLISVLSMTAMMW